MEAEGQRPEGLGAEHVQRGPGSPGDAEDYVQPNPVLMATARLATGELKKP